jgi:hypothetical protein
MVKRAQFASLSDRARLIACRLQLVSIRAHSGVQPPFVSMAVICLRSGAANCSLPATDFGGKRKALSSDNTLEPFTRMQR